MRLGKIYIGYGHYYSFLFLFYRAPVLIKSRQSRLMFYKTLSLVAAVTCLGVMEGRRGWLLAWVHNKYPGPRWEHAGVVHHAGMKTQVFQRGTPPAWDPA